MVGTIEDLTPMLVGRDPLDIEQAVRMMKKQSFWRLGVIGMSAVSGIEMALWDILGKHLGGRSGACSAARCATKSTPTSG